jgi:hypothetical protein
MGKSSINGPFSMAMLNNQRVDHKFHGSKRPVLMAFLPVKRTREILGAEANNPSEATIAKRRSYVTWVCFYHPIGDISKCIIYIYVMYINIYIYTIIFTHNILYIIYI